MDTAMNCTLFSTHAPVDSSGKQEHQDNEGDGRGLRSQEATFQWESRQRISKQAKEVEISDPPTVAAKRGSHLPHLLLRLQEWWPQTLRESLPLPGQDVKFLARAPEDVLVLYSDNMMKC